MMTMYETLDVYLPLPRIEHVELLSCDLGQPQLRTRQLLSPPPPSPHSNHELSR
jgi:hypothetical protein